MGKKTQAVVGLALLVIVGSTMASIIGNRVSDATTPPARCETGSPVGGRFYVQGRDVNFRVGPGTNYDRVINRKGTEALGQTTYRTLDSVMVLRGTCDAGDWIQADIVESEGAPVAWETGWVSKQFVRTTPNADQEAGLMWDVMGEKDLSGDDRSFLRMAALKVLKDEPECGTIFWGFRDEGRQGRFYVACRGKRDGQRFNVSFTRQDLASGTKLVRS
jgi:hypothetical protein